MREEVFPHPLVDVFGVSDLVAFILRAEYQSQLAAEAFPVRAITHHHTARPCVYVDRGRQHILLLVLEILGHLVEDVLLNSM